MNQYFICTVNSNLLVGEESLNISRLKKVPRIVNKNELKFKNIKSWFAFQLIKNANESCKVGYITLGNA